MSFNDHHFVSNLLLLLEFFAVDLGLLLKKLLMALKSFVILGNRHVVQKEL